MVMPRLSLEKFGTLAPRMSGEQRRAVTVAGVAHALHDGYTDLIYIMLPLWQAEFGLTYAALGLLRSMFAGAMASLQIPAGYLSERFGAAIILALGTALAGLGYCVAGMSAGFVMLLGALLLGGIGASTQHPIASALVARAFAGAGSLKAIGAYNFAGDLGKMSVPALLSLMLLVMAWRPALFILGAFGIAIAVAILFATPGEESRRAVAHSQTHRAELERKHEPLAFALLTGIGVIDSATRMGFLLFLPFVLTEKGASLQTIGLAMTLIFAGGAAGKLACAFIGARRVDRSRHSGAVATAAAGRPRGPAADRGCAQRHVVGAIRFGSRSRRSTLAHARAEHFLHRHDRLGRDRAGVVRPPRRLDRRVAGFDFPCAVRVADAADCLAAAAAINAGLKRRTGAKAK